MLDEDLQACIAKLPTAAYTCDSSGLLTGYNAHAVNLWGRSPRLHSKKQRYCGSYQILTADGSPILHEHSCMAQVLNTGAECLGKELIYQWEDRRQVWALVDASPIRDPLGRLIGGIGLMREIGAQKQNQLKLEKELMDYRRTELLIHESHEEEQRLAMHFLHEDVGQRLTGIALMAGVLHKALAKEHHHLAKKAAEVSKLTGSCIAAASDLAKGIYPLNIEVDGLPVALEFLAQRAESLFKISCTLLRCDSCQCAPDHAIHIYRIIQIAILEAIQNHAAGTVVIELGSANGRHFVRITHDIQKQTFKALPNACAEIDLLNSRARLIGASIEIHGGQARHILLSWPATVARNH